MIATIEGRFTERIHDLLVIVSSGIGYGVQVPLSQQTEVKIGDTVKLYIYEHIRESAHDLFGFTSQQEMILFETLLGVSGVGPKMALSILSVGNGNEVRQAIASGDVSYIQQASGVGKRVAERIIVELKDKVGLDSIDIAATGLLTGSSAGNGDEAVEALVALGFSLHDAISLLKDVDSALPVEQRVKQALRSRA